MENLNAAKMVKDYIEDNRYSKASLARAMGISNPSLSKRLNGTFMDVESLIRFSKFLNHDFFSDISDLLEVQKSKNETDIKIQELEKEVEILKRERDLLSEILKGRL